MDKQKWFVSQSVKAGIYYRQVLLQDSIIKNDSLIISGLKLSLSGCNEILFKRTGEVNQRQTELNLEKQRNKNLSFTNRVLIVAGLILGAVAIAK